MRKLKPTILFVALCSVCIVATVGVWAHRGVDIRGEITRLSRAEDGKVILGHILVEGAKEPDTQFDKAHIKVTTQTALFIEEGGGRRPAVFADVREGQRVEVRFSGPVLESYPVQATASEITILSQ